MKLRFRLWLSPSLLLWSPQFQTPSSPSAFGAYERVTLAPSSAIFQRFAAKVSHSSSESYACHLVGVGILLAGRAVRLQLRSLTIRALRFATSVSLKYSSTSSSSRANSSNCLPISPSIRCTTSTSYCVTNDIERPERPASMAQRGVRVCGNASQRT